MIYCKRCKKNVETHDSVGKNDSGVSIICNECSMTVGILYD